MSQVIEAVTQIAGTAGERQLGLCDNVICKYFTRRLDYRRLC